MTLLHAQSIGIELVWDLNKSGDKSITDMDRVSPFLP